MFFSARVMASNNRNALLASDWANGSCGAARAFFSSQTLKSQVTVKIGAR